MFKDDRCWNRFTLSRFSHNGEYTLYWMDWTLRTNTQTPSLHCMHLFWCVCICPREAVTGRLLWLSSPAPKRFPPWSVWVCRVVVFKARPSSSLLFFLLAVILQEEVVTGHSESSHQYDELGEIDLPVVVGVQVSHHLIHCLLILSILHV